MVGLATVCGVFPYVRAKVDKQPDQYSGEALTELLRGTILGTYSLFDAGCLGSFGRIFQQTLNPERLKLVSFLLDRCAEAKRRKELKKSLVSLSGFLESHNEISSEYISSLIELLEGKRQPESHGMSLIKKVFKRL